MNVKVIDSYNIAKEGGGGYVALEAEVLYILPRKTV
jgi:hypothetical protein